MNKSWIALVALVLAVPAFGQDEPAEAEPAAEEPADEAPAEDAAATGEPAGEETPGEPWALYFAADNVNTTLARSAPVNPLLAELDSTMVRLRAGARVFEAVGFELQYGIDRADDFELPTDAFYGAYLVPTATVIEVLELAFPVGYGRTEFLGANKALGSVSYGMEAQIPLRAFFDGLPDLRLVGGWMVYYQKSDARVYGGSVGLRYDFSL